MTLRDVKKAFDVCERPFRGDLSSNLAAALVRVLTKVFPWLVAPNVDIANADRIVRTRLFHGVYSTLSSIRAIGP